MAVGVRFKQESTYGLSVKTVAVVEKWQLWRGGFDWWLWFDCGSNETRLLLTKPAYFSNKSQAWSLVSFGLKSSITPKDGDGMSRVIETESIRKLSNFTFQWTKTLYQNSLSNIAFFFTFFNGYRYNLLSVITPKTIFHGSPRK